MMFKQFILALCLSAMASLGQAQTPLKIITTDQPGGGMDALIRPVAEKLGTALGRPVIVENKPGAQGRLGGQAVVNSAPDGNTVLITVQAGIVINPHVYTWPYNSLTDLVPVTELGRGSLVLLVPSSLKVNTMKELAQWITAQPKGSASYATYSPGTISHFGGLLLAQDLGVDMMAVHYKASGDQVKDLVSGIVNMGWGPAAGSVAQLVKAGRLKALAYMGPKRIPAFPDVPTIREAGHPIVETDGWIGIFAPKGTPTEVVDKLQQEFAKVLSSADTRNMYLNFGFEPGGSTAVEFGKLVKSDSQKFADYIKKINYKVE